MRTLIFKNPIPITQTRIHKGESFENPTARHYSRFSTVFTKYGICTVLEFDWETNFGNDEFTQFETVIDGEVWRAESKEGKYNELQLKWMATHFMKKCVDAYCGKITL